MAGQAAAGKQCEDEQEEKCGEKVIEMGVSCGGSTYFCVDECACLLSAVCCLLSAVCCLLSAAVCLPGENGLGGEAMRE